MKQRIDAELLKRIRQDPKNFKVLVGYKGIQYAQMVDEVIALDNYRKELQQILERANRVRNLRSTLIGLTKQMELAKEEIDAVEATSQELWDMTESYAWDGSLEGIDEVAKSFERIIEHVKANSTKKTKSSAVDSTSVVG